MSVTWGEDVPPSEINGTYKLLNKVSGATGNVVSYTSSGDIIKQSKYTGAKKQQWTVKPCSARIGGDFSFYDIESVDNANIRMNVKDYSKPRGAQIVLRECGREALLIVHTFENGAKPRLDEILSGYQVKAAYGSDLSGDFGVHDR